MTDPSKATGFEDFTKPIGKDAGAVTVSAVPFWGDNPAAWDTVIINGVAVPGTCSVGGKAFETRVDKKKIPGTTGAKQTTLGRQPAEPEVTIKIWTQEHLEQLEQIIEMFLPRGSKQLPPPVQIIHPSLALYGIKSVRVMTASFPEHKKEQVFEVRLKCLEFVIGKPGKPKTDLASADIVKRYGGKTGADTALSKLRERTSPEHTNGNAPRGKT